MDLETLFVLSCVAGVVLIALALLFQRLKVDVKKGDVAVSIDASRTPDRPEQPAIANQTNVGHDVYKAKRDAIHVERDLHVHEHHDEAKTPALGLMHQITEPVPDFVGRAKEIDELAAALRGAGQGAVISGVRGMGGVGKTELAKVVAREVKDLFPDGQISLDLRGASKDEASKPVTASEALAHVIRSFHPEAPLPEEVGQLQAVYHSVLDGKQVLLLMDNALNAQQLAPLTPPPKGCALLVTSRNRFVLSGMTEIDLDTLAPEEARDLMVKICPRIGEQADVLAERCGYLPLALRLAASALKACPDLSVDDYLRDLSDEKKRLEALEEYRSFTDIALGVEASLGISYRLLDETQQRRWRALAVFVGDFDAAAAAAVWDADEGEAKKTLQKLRAASMLEWVKAGGRYRLHDLARDYARSGLSAEERDADALRHATHYEAVLRAAKEFYKSGNDGVLQGLALFDREWPNIRAGQTWAAANWYADDATARLCCDYPDTGVYCLSLRLHPRELICWLETAVMAARKLGWRAAEGSHLGNLGVAYADLGETRKAIECHEQALVISREIGDRRGEGNALGNLGIAYRNLGKTRKAIEYYEQALIISREIADRRGEGNALGNLGLAYRNLGETRKAIEWHEQALVISREIGDRRGEGCDLGNLGLAYKDLGETRKAIEYYEQRLVIAREIGDKRGEGNALGNLGSAYYLLGETRKAIEYYEQRLVIAREIGDRRGEGNVLGNLGNAYAALGETRKAIEYYEQRLVIAREIGDRRGEGNALHNMAGELVKVGRRDEAVACAEQAVAIYEQIESPHLDMARAQLEELRSGDGGGA